MFKLDLKQAEVAIKSGRLDHAFAVLSNSPQTNHAEGQRLVEQLVDEFVVRANLHLENGRLETALMDVKKAEQLAGQRIDIAELKSKIVAKRVSLAGRERAVDSASAAEQLKSLVGENDHEAAIQWLAEHPCSEEEKYELKQLACVSADFLQRMVKDDFDNGRLDLCVSNLERLLAAGYRRQKLSEMMEQLDRCRLALRHVRGAEFDLAIEQLQLTARISNDATWILVAIAALSQCQENLLATCSGPLGLLDQKVSVRPKFSEPENEQVKQIRDQDQPALDDVRPEKGNEVRGDVLQVDQLGGVLLLRGKIVSVGTPSIAKSADIVLQTEGLRAKIEIARDGEDYFATSGEEFLVNNVLAGRHLLSPGDSITVGTRGRLKFIRPMPASNSAVLMVHGARMKRRDIRGIVLVDESVVFGDSGCHFSVPDLPHRVIVRPTDHNLGSRYAIHEKGSTDRQVLTVGQPKNVAGVQFTLLPSTSTPRERVS